MTVRTALPCGSKISPGQARGAGRRAQGAERGAAVSRQPRASVEEGPGRVEALDALDARREVVKLLPKLVKLLLSNSCCQGLSPRPTRDPPAEAA